MQEMWAPPFPSSRAGGKLHTAPRRPLMLRCKVSPGLLELINKWWLKYKKQLLQYCVQKWHFIVLFIHCSSFFLTKTHFWRSSYFTLDGEETLRPLHGWWTLPNCFKYYINQWHMKNEERQKYIYKKNNPTRSFRILVTKLYICSNIFIFKSNKEGLTEMLDDHWQVPSSLWGQQATCMLHIRLQFLMHGQSIS